MLCAGSGCSLDHDSRRLHHPAAHGCQLGQPEVENFGVAAFRHEDVGRLDVSVDDTFGMSSVERIGNFDG